MATNPKIFAEKNAPQKNAPPPGERPLVVLEVWAVPACNTAIIICHAPGTDGSDPTVLVSVQVRTNINFRKKMRLWARYVRDKQYALEGPTPRTPGHW